MPRRKKRRERGMGTRSHGRGSLELDMTVEGVHIRRATGTTDPVQYDHYRQAVRMLGSGGRVDILRQLTEKRGRQYVLKFSEVWDAVRPLIDRPANLNRLPSPLTIRKLYADGSGAFEMWARGIKTSASASRSKLRDVKALRRFSTREQRVADLPAILAAYRDYCEARGTLRVFDMTRNTVQAFLRDTVKRSHPLYGEVLDIPAFGGASRPGKPLTPDELRAWLPEVEQAMGRMYSDAFLGMCVTGMRPAEFWGDWSILSDRVRLRSAKQKNKADVVYRETPLIASFGAPEMTIRTYETAFVRRGLNVIHTPYDARRTFARACEESGVPESRRKAYMGHSASAVSDLYVRHEVTPFLADDARKLRIYLGLSRTKPRTEDGIQL